VLQIVTKRRAQRSIDPRLPSHLRLLEYLQAAVQRQLLRAVGADVPSVPRTSTRPAAVTRTCTLLREGMWYPSPGRPSAANDTGWHGHCRMAAPLSHHSSHGRWEQIADTALIESPRRKTKALTLPATTCRPWPSTSSLVAATSTHRPLTGSMAPPPPVLLVSGAALRPSK